MQGKKLVIFFDSYTFTSGMHCSNPITGIKKSDIIAFCIVFKDKEQREAFGMPSVGPELTLPIWLIDRSHQHS